MQTVPDNYQISELRENLLKAVPQIIDIHEVCFDQGDQMIWIKKRQIFSNNAQNGTQLSFLLGAFTLF